MGRKRNYKKGLEFENKFAEYMLSELKYDNCKVRKSMTGKENVKGVQADIIGIINDKRGMDFRKYAIIMLISVMFILVGIFMNLLSEDWAYIILVLIAGAVVYSLLSQKLDNKYTWVECKNHAEHIGIKIVRDFYHEVQDHNNSQDKKITVHKMIFVVASGFVDNALQFASEKGIDCYIKDGESFKKIIY